MNQLLTISIILNTRSIFIMRIYHEWAPESKLKKPEPLSEEDWDQVKNNYLEFIKYRLMWVLRNLEEEIDSFPQAIMKIRAAMDIDTRIECNGFSKDFYEKIHSAISEIDICYWQK